MFSYISLEKRVPPDHPLRRVREMTDRALQELSPRFGALYSRYGRPSIAPEKLLRALLLQALYSLRSERLLIEALDFNLLYRWFVGLRMDEDVWDVTVFTKNRERLLEGNIAEEFFDAVLQEAQERGLLSDEHFTVDGTLIQAWASGKSFQEKKDPPERGTGSGGRLTLRDTHQSRTDPEARLYKIEYSRTGAAQLHGTSGDGEPERTDREIVRDAVGNAGRTAGGTGDARGDRAEGKVQARRGPGVEPDGGGGQGVSEERIHRRTATIGSGAACGRICQEPAAVAQLLDAERAQSPGICHQSEEANPDREEFWLDQIRRGILEDKISRAARVGWAFDLLAAALNLIRLVKLLPCDA